MTQKSSLTRVTWLLRCLFFHVFRIFFLFSYLLNYLSFIYHVWLTIPLCVSPLRFIAHTLLLSSFQCESLASLLLSGVIKTIRFCLYCVLPTLLSILQIPSREKILIPLGVNFNSVSWSLKVKKNELKAAVKEGTRWSCKLFIFVIFLAI